MPTNLPTRRTRRPDLFVIFLIAFAAGIALIEVVDPTPMDVEAALVTSP